MTKAKTKKPLFKDFKKNLPLLLLTIPGAAYIIINNYLPMFGVFIAFKRLDYAKGLFASPWVGFENFEFLFSTAEAPRMIRNTVLYNVVFIVVGTLFAVIVAVLMSEITQFSISKFYQGSMIIPNLISMVIVSYIVYCFPQPRDRFGQLHHQGLWRCACQLVQQHRSLAVYPSDRPNVENCGV